MKRVSLLLTVCSFFIANLAFSQNINFANLERDGLTVIDTDEYQIVYPIAWGLDASGRMGSEWIMTLPADSRGVEGTNVNLMVEDLQGKEITLEEYAAISITSIEEALEDGELLYSETKGDVLNGKVHRLAFNGNFQGIDMQWQQQYWIKNGKAYVMTFTSFPETVDEFQKDIDALFRSMYIRPAEH